MEKPISVIRLYRTPEGWVARHSGPIADEVRRLFGTDTLPTAYTAQADPREVLAVIRRRNLDCQVIIVGTV